MQILELSNDAEIIEDPLRSYWYQYFLEALERYEELARFVQKIYREDHDQKYEAADAELYFRILYFKKYLFFGEPRENGKYLYAELQYYHVCINHYGENSAEVVRVLTSLGRDGQQPVHQCFFQAEFICLKHQPHPEYNQLLIDVYIAISEMYCKSQDYASAQTVLKKAQITVDSAQLTLTPCYHGLQLALARFHFYQKKSSQAIQVLSRMHECLVGCSHFSRLFMSVQRLLALAHIQAQAMQPALALIEQEIFILAMIYDQRSAIFAQKISELMTVYAAYFSIADRVEQFWMGQILSQLQQFGNTERAFDLLEMTQTVIQTAKEQLLLPKPAGDLGAYLDPCEKAVSAEAEAD